MLRYFTFWYTPLFKKLTAKWSCFVAAGVTALPSSSAQTSIWKRLCNLSELQLVGPIQHSYNLEEALKEIQI